MINITRRQFLQYCAASAAALGLSQTDLLKLEKALATPQDATSNPSPSVIWISAQACSGCPVSLLNRMVAVNGKYYDADMINALYGTILPEPTTVEVALNDPASYTGGHYGAPAPPAPFGDDRDALGFVNPLAVVNDAADLLVGDAVRALTSISRSLLWADDAEAAVDGTLLPTDTLLASYLAGTAGDFSTGYVTLDWNATVMAAAGDIPVKHLRDIREGGGALGVFVLVVDGAVPTKDENYCYVFDNYMYGTSASAIQAGDAVKGGGTFGTGRTIPAHEESISANLAIEWLASAPGCLGVISMGTCSSFGGIPAGQGNKTGAKGVHDYLTSYATPGTYAPVVNVPGCPPHPDWFVYAAAYILSHTTTGGGLTLRLPPLDDFRRPVAVFSGGAGNKYDPFCIDCPNQARKEADPNDIAEELGDSGCLLGKGCKGQYTVGDCPIRQKNTADDGTLMNWCVGSQGERPYASSLRGTTRPQAVATGIGAAYHPCQGCIMPSFPDWGHLGTQRSNRTTKRVKGFYNE